ncbi:MAG: hypothetical protein LBN18_05845 [Dysgonamonadaceae bacterium]|jgi:hypothetical protein|nr:hypothetical protein [Dysgonamonadaceae bacterium]
MKHLLYIGRVFFAILGLSLFMTSAHAQSAGYTSKNEAKIYGNPDEHFPVRGTYQRPTVFEGNTPEESEGSLRGEIGGITPGPCGDLPIGYMLLLGAVLGIYGLRVRKS